uniref:Uncharacterized protein n=1 Tax=Thermus caliditerrae TaxID=1330700 RepID=A0A7C5RF46_9DEIN
MRLDQALLFLRATGSLLVKLPAGKRYRLVFHERTIRTVIDETNPGGPRTLYPEEARAAIAEIARFAEAAEALPSPVEVPIRHPDRQILVQPEVLRGGSREVQV